MEKENKNNYNPYAVFFLIMSVAMVLMFIVAAMIITTQ